MAKKNYESWNIKIEDFPAAGTQHEQIEFLTRFALLAPSGHNSQPWRIHASDSQVALYINTGRNLNQSDPQGRQLYISLGCFLENLFTAADFFGFAFLPTYNYPDPSDGATPVAEITFQKRTPAEHKDRRMVRAIIERNSNRYPYRDEPLPQSFIDYAGTIIEPQIKIFLLTDTAQKDQAANIMEDAQIYAMDSADFRKELSEYIKSSYTEEPYGMPGFTLNIPGPVSILAPKLAKNINLSRLSKKQDSELLLRRTPALGVICASQDSRENWLSVGRVFERVWLRATSDGIAFSVWAAAIQHETFRARLQKILNTPLLPMAAFRAGLPKTKPGHSPRFSLKDLAVR